ncbi:MAG: MFS transporter [Clostridiales bacterium]|nr:MFS transporter [Clostridiales bacterium]
MESSRADFGAQRSVRPLTAGIVILIIVFGLLNNYQSVVLNSVVASYHLVGGAQGIMSSMINIGSIAAYFSAPALQGRLKKTSMLVIACVLLVASFFLLGQTRLFTGMIIASIIAGVGFGWMDTNCNAVMVDIHPEKSASYLGALHGGFGVGGLTAPLLITALLAMTTWHGASFVMSGIIACAGLAFLLILAFSAKGAPPAPKEKPLTREMVKAYLFRRKNALMLVAAMLYAVTQSGLIVWIVRYMTLRYNAEALGSAALSIYWICATLSRFFAPRLPVRPLRLFFVGMVLMCVFQTVGVLSGNPIVMCVMVGVVGIVSGHSVPILLSEASSGQQENSSLVASSFLVSMCFLRSITPVFMGFLADWTNVSVMMLTPAAGGALAALIAWVMLRDERREGVLVPVQ